MTFSSLPDRLPVRPLLVRARERLRANLGKRLTGAVIALALEALLLLALLSLGQMRPPHKEVPVATVTFDARDYSEAPRQPEPKPPHRVGQRRA